MLVRFESASIRATKSAARSSRSLRWACSRSAMATCWAALSRTRRLRRKSSTKTRTLVRSTSGTIGERMKSTAPYEYPRSACISSAWAVTNRIGVWAHRLRPRMSWAVSKPSIPGMLTSRRTSANSSRRRWRSASSPDAAATSSMPGSSRTDRYTSCCSGRSSTTRIFTTSEGRMSLHQGRRYRRNHARSTAASWVVSTGLAR